MNKKIRIKDIAERAGVSVGTVDRVLHNRPNVSAASLAKVNNVLKELNYEPNMYASALAYNRSFTFYCLMPRHASEAYWDEVEDGMVEAVEFRRDFQIDVKFIHYSRLDAQSFEDAASDCMLLNPDGVILVPPAREQAKAFADKLHATGVPLVLLDSYMADLQPLAFFGQDSFQSGYFAAKILMLIAGGDPAIMLMKQGREGYRPSQQQENREVGFRHYMENNFPQVDIKTLTLPLDGTQKDNDRLLDDFFRNHPEVRHCITFNSRAWIVGEYLQRRRCALPFPGAERGYPSRQFHAHRTAVDGEYRLLSAFHDLRRPDKSRFHLFAYLLTQAKTDYGDHSAQFLPASSLRCLRRR